MLNQQSFDAPLDVACVYYVCDKVYRILNLLKDEVYKYSSGFFYWSLSVFCCMC